MILPETPKIESQDLNIQEVFKDFYVVPDYQREYVWEESNVEALFKDVYDEFYDEEGNLRDSSEYFIGSIVVCNNDDGTFQLIDGQQRLTTLYLGMCVFRDILHNLGSDPPQNLLNKIQDISMDSKTGEDIKRFRLELQYVDSNGILEKIAQKSCKVEDIPQSTTSVKHISLAYYTIYDFLSTQFSKNPAQIKKFFAAISQRLKLIRIKTPNVAHALKVFETINDRGIGLNSMDLLKNLLFMRTPESEYRILKSKWKSLIDELDACREKPLRFLRYYIMSH